VGHSVTTVTGEVAAERLGFILAHEHITFAPCGWDADSRNHVSHSEMAALAIGRLRAARDVGVDTIIDPTTPELGRDLRLAREVSEQTGVHVICATGLYSRWSTPYFQRRSVEEIADFFTSELVDGDRATGIRPTFVKVATDGDELSPYEQKALHAAGLAHRATGAPIMVHIEPYGARAVLRVLVDELGVPGHKIVIAHADGAPDLRYLLEIIEGHGSYVGFDRFGLENRGVRDDVRRALILALFELGHGDRIHLAHDSLNLTVGPEELSVEKMRAVMPNWHLTYISESIVPALLKNGLTQADVDQMTRGNPLAWLTS
jgi:phosphotriesterase-related protein